MGPFQWFLFVYCLGGLTFIPLVLAVALYIGWRTLPVQDGLSAEAKNADPADLMRNDDGEFVLKTGTDDLAEKFHRKHDSDVAAGYFAVCREWVPGGVNGKPPDRLSPAGETIVQESPSVYQTMYRSLFDRSQKPTIEPQKDGAGKNVRRANNIFYVVLRHGHLMLYDDIQQLEVRYVISLEHHDVDIYAGSDEHLPEGELWVKRHAIRLTRKPVKDVSHKLSLPFFLFGENLSEKEDFYHALLKNQERSGPDAPVAEDFDTSFIVKLVQKLHSSEEQLQTRWLNAFIGRLFLATYKTPELEDFLRSKLTKKISRVKKPTFITRISLHKIDTGTGAPFLTNPRLKDLTVNGDCVAEVDVEYTGGFRIEIGATARIDLGKRFGAREVDMLLAVTLKRVQGHMLIRFKPPPSNRIWFTFEKMPQMDLALEPIVSSRKITYSVILSAMESRIREVFAESLVLPFWDDVPFLDTTGQQHRGGIWKRERTTTSVEIKDETPEDEADTAASTSDDIKAINVDDRNFSTPALPGESGFSYSRSADRKSVASLPVSELTGVEGEKTPPVRMPRILRAPSFANAAGPKVTANHVDSENLKGEAESSPKREAAAILKDLSARSGSPSDHVEESPPKESAMAEVMKERPASIASKSSLDGISGPSRTSTFDIPNSPSLANTDSRPSTPGGPGFESKRSSTYDETKPNKSLAQAARSMTAADRKQALASATAAAQKWGSSLGWGVLAKKQKDGSGADQVTGSTLPDGTPSAPMGRGQPLPPPGQPLPRPPKTNIMSNIPFMAPKKPPLPKRAETTESTGNASPNIAPSKPPPLPDRRRRKSTLHSLDQSENGDDLLIVEAPAESTPASPVAERPNHVSQDDFFGGGEDVEEDRRSGLEEKRYDRPPEIDSKPATTRQDLDKASENVNATSVKDTAENGSRNSSSLSSDKENYKPTLPPRRKPSESVEDSPLAPRPSPPARTGSSDSSDRRSSRIPAPVSLGTSSMKRKSQGITRQASNLSLQSRSDAGDGSPRLGSSAWFTDVPAPSLADESPRNHQRPFGTE